MENRKPEKKDVAKAYEKYATKFTPKPKYFTNCLKAFVVGGLICAAAAFVQNKITAAGMNEEDAGTFVTIILICLAQLLTGIGVFDTIGKFAGAGVIVPITGFANSMVSPALEYKKEGLVTGLGTNIFKLAGTVIMFGIVSAYVFGIVRALVFGG